jgi:hypothetical protein
VRRGAVPPWRRGTAAVSARPADFPEDHSRLFVVGFLRVEMKGIARVSEENG